MRAPLAVPTVVEIDVGSSTSDMRSLFELRSSLRALRARRHLRDLDRNLVFLGAARLALCGATLLTLPLTDRLDLRLLESSTALVAAEKSLDRTELLDLLLHPRTSADRQLARHVAGNLVPRDVATLVVESNKLLDLLVVQRTTRDGFDLSDGLAAPLGFGFDHESIIERLDGQLNTSEAEMRLHTLFSGRRTQHRHLFVLQRLLQN